MQSMAELQPGLSQQQKTEAKAARQQLVLGLQKQVSGPSALYLSILTSPESILYRVMFSTVSVKFSLL